MQTRQKNPRAHKTGVVQEKVGLNLLNGARELWATSAKSQTKAAPSLFLSETSTEQPETG